MSNILNKKGQMKIQQMAFMLIAITLFFVFAGLLVLTFVTGNLKKSATQLGENNAVMLVEKLANSPEFSCGDAFYSKSNCIDSDKIMVLKENPKYEDFWGVAGIQLIKLYPKEQNIECNQQNYPNCNKITVISKNISQIYVSNFVTLCRKENNNQVYDKCEIAQLLVSYEVKT